MHPKKSWSNYGIINVPFLDNTAYNRLHVDGGAAFSIVEPYLQWRCTNAYKKEHKG